MGENCVAQHGVRQAAQHRRLDCCHHLACFHAEHSESQYAVTLNVDKHFDEAAGFPYSDGLIARRAVARRRCRKCRL